MHLFGAEGVTASRCMHEKITADVSRFWGVTASRFWGVTGAGLRHDAGTINEVKLFGSHVYMHEVNAGTCAATIRGAYRAARPSREAKL